MKKNIIGNMTIVFWFLTETKKKKNASEHSSAGKFQHLSKMVENKTGMVVLGLQWHATMLKRASVKSKDTV